MCLISWDSRDGATDVLLSPLVVSGVFSQWEKTLGIHITQWYGDGGADLLLKTWPAGIQTSSVLPILTTRMVQIPPFISFEGKRIYLFVSRSMVCPHLMLLSRWVGEWVKHLLWQGTVYGARTSVCYPRKALTLHVHVYGFQHAARVCFSWNPVLTMLLLILGGLWWFYLLAKCLA